VEKEKIKQLLIDSRERSMKSDFVHRDLQLDYSFFKTTGKITAILGARRVGKSVFLRQIFHDTAAAPEELITIDFSEFPWMEFSADDFEKLWQAAQEIGCGSTPLCLFDEIQNCGEFAPGLRFLQNRGARIFLTGSNAEIFTGALAASLRGKLLTYTLYPLSFVEFLRFRNTEFPSVLSTNDRARRRVLLEEYLTWGGFPEVVLAEREELKRNLLDSYWDIMLFRDIVERHAVKNVEVLEKLLVRILLSFTREFSVHKWFNDLKSQGYRVSKDSMYEFVNYFEQAMFVHILSNAASAAGSRKIYLIDNGLYNRVKDRPDMGKLFENLCFLDLLRAGQDTTRFFRTDQYEVDFVTDRELLQVTVELHEQNRVREETPLVEVGRLFPGHSQRILTMDTY